MFHIHVMIHVLTCVATSTTVASLLCAGRAGQGRQKDSRANMPMEDAARLREAELHASS